jgi:hypothetical protein
LDDKPVFADLLAQYMALTGDRSLILKSDRLLSSLEGKSIAFCNVEEGPVGRKTQRANGIISPDRLLAPVLRRSAFLETLTAQNRRDLAQ